MIWLCQLLLYAVYVWYIYVVRCELTGACSSRDYVSSSSSSIIIISRLTLLACLGVRYCGRDQLVKRCFTILNTDYHDWMSFAFLPNHAVYQSTCAR